MNRKLIWSGSLYISLLKPVLSAITLCTPLKNYPPFSKKRHVMFAVAKCPPLFRQNRQNMSTAMSTYISLKISLCLSVFTKCSPHIEFFFIILYFFLHKRMFELLIFTDPTLTILNDLFTSVQFCWDIEIRMHVLKIFFGMLQQFITV